MYIENNILGNLVAVGGRNRFGEFNINWTKLYQESMEPEYEIHGAKGNVTGPKEEKVLFKTTFTNTTQREQEYSFKTERCTRSSSTVIIEKGVCRGMEVALKLKTPCEVVEANAGFHQEVQLNHIGELICLLQKIFPNGTM
ncbi:unnamed protein product [Haemonchus placei]|uniref:PRKCSH_1 domain-containing protein n=1 Tax=Haemonchus placei TaxID=6290 RepID=A0A0N4VWZ8_HAEPC|nr:unnamed protein product [Haemonchus placei]